MLEERLDGIKDLKQKIQLIKLEKGETSKDDWAKGVHDRINAFEDIKDELEAALEKLEVTQDQRTKVKKVKREKEDEKKKKIEEAKLKMRSEFEKRMWRRR